METGMTEKLIFIRGSFICSSNCCVHIFNHLQVFCFCCGCLVTVMNYDDVEENHHWCISCWGASFSAAPGWVRRSVEFRFDICNRPSLLLTFFVLVDSLFAQGDPVCRLETLTTELLQFLSSAGFPHWWSSSYFLYSQSCRGAGPGDFGVTVGTFSGFDREGARLRSCKVMQVDFGSDSTK